MLADFHIHTKWSDGANSIKEVIDMYGERGFRIIAITDHVCEVNTVLGRTAQLLKYSLTNKNFQNYLDEIQAEAFRAWKKYRMVVISGIEISKNSFANHRSAHILGLGIRKWVNPELPIKNILQEIKSQGAVTVAAHPVPTREFQIQTLHLWENRDKLSPLIDLWEVASGAYLFEPVVKSGLPVLANSDFHHQGHHRSWKTVVHSDLEESKILQAIKNQDIELSFYNNHEAQVNFYPKDSLKLRKMKTVCPWPY